MTRMQDEQLSTNFTLKELTRSMTAEAHGLDNTPSTAEIHNLRILATQVLQPARDIINKPFIINSGYRSKEVNKAVGGVSNSYHLKGQAADIHVDNAAMGAAVSAALLSSELTDMVILEKRKGNYWVHVQWSFAPRHLYRQDLK